MRFYGRGLVVANGVENEFSADATPCRLLAAFNMIVHRSHLNHRGCFRTIIETKHGLDSATAAARAHRAG